MRQLTITLLASALVASGCASSTADRPGVRKRVVAVVPLDQVPVLPQQVPRPGRVRIGVSGSVAPADRTEAPEPADGQHHTPRRSGEVFVGVGMPGRARDREAFAGWELVGGATAAAAPAARGHDLEPTLVAPDRGVRGGYLRINGLMGTATTVLGASLALSAAAIAFAWDYGDCGGGSSCVVWYRKGPPATGRNLAWGLGGSATLWHRVGERGGFVLGAGFDRPPSIATEHRDDQILCDGTGRCTRGQAPAAPDATMDTFHGQLLFGVDFQPVPWSRLFVLLARTKRMADHVDDETEGFVQMRAGLEASF